MFQLLGFKETVAEKDPALPHYACYLCEAHQAGVKSPVFFFLKVFFFFFDMGHFKSLY